MREPTLRTERVSRALALASILALCSIAACAPTTAEATASVPATASGPQEIPAPAAAPVSSLPPPPPASATDVLAQGRAPFDACYATARKTRPDLQRTRVEITFTMDDNGKLLNVDFAYRNRWDDAAKDCMRAAAEALTFPPSLHGKQTGTIVFTPP